MRRILLAAAGASLAWVTLAPGPAAAQTTPAAKPPATRQRPIDVGPNTPAANGAYQGGGVILQGAPGAPAPQPQPTPPGQTPKNAVQP